MDLFPNAISSLIFGEAGDECQPLIVVKLY